MSRSRLTTGLAVLTASYGWAADYEVGDGKSYPSIGSVPWESLQAGDNVLIYWRTAPYKEKSVIGGQGTEAAPITVRGVPGPDGQLPVIDGEDATTRTQLDYWNENRSVIKVGGSSVPPDVTPRYVVIENLDVRRARPPNTFTDGATITTTALPVLTIQYHDLLADPAREVDRIIEYLGPTVRPEQRRHAILLVEPMRKVHWPVLRSTAFSGASLPFKPDVRETRQQSRPGRRAACWRGKRG